MNFLEHHIDKILVATQKYTKVDMRYLAKNGFWLGLQQAITIIAAFAFSVVMANFVSKTDYGTYRFFLSIMAFFLVFSLPGISVALITGVANKKIKSVSSMIQPQLIFGLLGSLFAVCVSFYYFLNEETVLGIVFLISAFFVPFFDSLLLYESWLRGEKKFKKVSFYRSTTQVLFTILFSLFVIFSNESVVSMIVLYLFLFSSLRLFFFVKTFGLSEFKKIFKNNTPDLEEKKLIIFGKHLSLMNSFSFIALTVDKIIVFSFLGSTTLAVYAFALALPDQIKSAIKQLISVALPKYAERNILEIKKTVMYRLFMICLLVGMLSFVYILLSPLLYKVFFPQYMESIKYTQILGLILIPNAGIFFLRTILNAKERTKEQYIFNFSYPVVQIALFFAGFLFAGLYGVVWAQVFAQIFGMVLLLFLTMSIKDI